MRLKDESSEFLATHQKIFLDLTVVNAAVHEKNNKDQFPYKLNKDSFVMPPANLDGWIIDPQWQPDL